MAKKITITEEQLKRIVAHNVLNERHTYSQTEGDETYAEEEKADEDIKEGDYQDYLDTNYSSDGMDDYSKQQDDLRKADALYQIGKLFHQIGRREESEKYRQEALGYGSFHTDDETWGPYDNPENDTMSEAKNTIKKTFQRFL